MPYSKTTFHDIAPDQVEHLLSLFTREHVVGGRAAYLLSDGFYSIDAGENDIRAIYDEQNEVIKFFCRYGNEMEFYDNKIQSFAASHNVKVSID